MANTLHSWCVAIARRVSRYVMMSTPRSPHAKIPSLSLRSPDQHAKFLPAMGSEQPRRRRCLTMELRIEAMRSIEQAAARLRENGVREEAARLRLRAEPPPGETLSPGLLRDIDSVIERTYHPERSN